jgi:hypothetical protein
MNYRRDHRFGNISTQPRFKRRITCFKVPDTGEWLPFIDPNKHRFTMYQANLNSNQLKIINTNDFTKQACGACGQSGHTRRSCWCIPHPKMNASFPSFQKFTGNDERLVSARYILFYIATTLLNSVRICWNSHIASGGKVGIEYLYDIGEENTITNIRVLAYKMDKDNKKCRCRNCHSGFSKIINQFPSADQETFKLTTQIETTDLRFLDDTELRDQLRNVEIKSDGQCPICMEEILNVDKVITKCGHVFCASCLFQNLGTSTVCPLCRESLANFTPISRKITRLEEELDLVREELNNKLRLLRRVQSMVRENI